MAEHAAEPEDQIHRTSPTSPHQYPLPHAIALHILPGVALTIFVLVASALGLEPALALFFGIGLVIVPIELGYLFLRARHLTGRWSLRPVLWYDRKPEVRKNLLLAFGSYVWFIAMLVLATVVLDEWIAGRLFSWLPDSILQFASLEGDDDESTVSTGVLLALIGLIFLLNGVAGPVTEELYFRGHLMPSIDRFGKWTPLLAAVLFSVYHFWTPWQNFTRILGLLPWMMLIYRTQSLRLSIFIHVAINLTFVLLLSAALIEENTSSDPG